MGKKKQKVVVDAEVVEEVVEERPDTKTREEIFANARTKQQDDDADSTGEDGEPVSALNEKMARVMEAESRGEEPDPADLEFGTEELGDEEDSDTASAEAMAREAAGEDIEEEEEDDDDDDSQDIVDEEEEESQDDGEKPSKSLKEYDPDDRIDVKVDGKTYSVPSWEVEEAGGLEAYRQKRAAARRLRIAGDRIATAQRDLAELAQQTASRSDVETLPEDDSDASQEETSAAKEAMKAIWAGDPDRAGEILDQALKQSRGKTQVSDGDDDSSAAQIELPASARALQQDIKADQQRQMDEANQLARDEFGDLCDDPVLKDVLFNKFASMYRDEENIGREMKDVVREAGLWLRGTMNQSVVIGRAEDKEVEKKVKAKIMRKRRTPRLSGAADRRPEQPKKQEDRPLKGSDAVARMKERFGQT